MEWKTLIEELQTDGLTQVEIGREIGLSQSSVVDVLKGRTKDLKWSVGQKLIKLHKAKITTAARPLVDHSAKNAA